MEKNEILLWLAVLVCSTMAGVCRACHNGNYKSLGHAIGIVGCASMGATSFVMMAQAVSATVRDNWSFAIGLAVTVALAGKEIYERLIIRVLAKVGLLGSGESADKE